MRCGNKSCIGILMNVWGGCNNKGECEIYFPEGCLIVWEEVEE